MCNFEKASQDELAASQTNINSPDEAVFQPEKVSQSTMNSQAKLTIQQAAVPLKLRGRPPKVSTALVISPQTSQLRRSNREKKIVNYKK